MILVSLISVKLYDGRCSYVLGSESDADTIPGSVIKRRADIIKRAQQGFRASSAAVGELF